MNRKTNVAAKDKLRTVKIVYSIAVKYGQQRHIASRREYKSQRILMLRLEVSTNWYIANQ